MKENKVHVVYLGFSGFPFGLAAVARQRLVSRGLINAGADVTVLCARSVHNAHVKISQIGIFEGVPYRYAVSPFRDQNFIVRNIKRKFDWLFELVELIKINRQKKITHLIVSNTNVFSYAVWISLVAIVLRFKVVLSLVEIYKERRELGTAKKLNDFLFNRYGLYFFDGYMPISHQLEEHFKSFKIPSFHFPILVDMDKLVNLGLYGFDSPNIVFCGAAGYLKTIAFVIESFDAITSTDVTLTLVSGGSAHEVDAVRQLISQSKKNNQIRHLMNLKDEELYSLYVESSALLLPLFDTVQDHARFPHKLAEYLASGTCVISNGVGDLLHYLKHDESAYIVPPGDANLFAKCIDEAISNPVKSKNIGKKGREVCENNFEFRRLGVLCIEFLRKLA